MEEPKADESVPGASESVSQIKSEEPKVEESVLEAVKSSPAKAVKFQEPKSNTIEESNAANISAPIKEFKVCTYDLILVLLYTVRRVLKSGLITLPHRS